MKKIILFSLVILTLIALVKLENKEYKKACKVNNSYECLNYLKGL